MEIEAKIANDDSFFNVNKKDPRVFRHQMQLMSDPLCIENFLSKDEVRLLLDIERGKPDHYRSIRQAPHGNTVVTFNPWENPEQTIIKDRLENIIGKFEVWGGNYFSTTVAYLPHVDTGENFQYANFKNIVIPLEIEPLGQTTHLILFKQRYFGNSTGFFASGVGADRKVTCNENLYDYSRVMFLDREHRIDPEILNTHLRHVGPKNLEGLSISHMLPWAVGSCLIFDSAQIHCSSEFTRNGTRRKSALSIFTYKQPS